MSAPPSIPSLQTLLVNRSLDFASSILVIILNIAEIIIISKLKRKKKIYEIFILSLSITDLLFGISNVSVSILFLSKNGNERKAIEIIYTTYFIFVLNSMLHLVWIAFDRLWAILKPFQRRNIATSHKLYTLLGVTWAFSIGLVCLLYIANQSTDAFNSRTTTVTYGNVTVNATSTIINEKATVNATLKPFELTTNGNETPYPTELKIIPKTESRNHYESSVKFTLASFIVIVDVIMLLSYATIVYMIKRPKELKTSGNAEDRASITCIFIASTFILLTLPFAVTIFTKKRIPFWANFMLLSNSGLNCIAYFFRREYDLHQHRKHSRKNQRQSKSAISMANLDENRNRGKIASSVDVKKEAKVNGRVEDSFRSTQEP